jgi:hypothetical protein
MAYRTLCILVIAFWLIMGGLLLKTEFHPDKSRLREVRIQHVLKLLFLHEQRSDLNIYSERTRFGRLRIYPHVEKATGRRLLEFDGDLQLRLPTLPKQRFSWSGVAAMDASLTTQLFELKFNMEEPISYSAEARIEPIIRRMSVLLRSKESVTSETFEFDEAGAWQELMRHFDVDPAVVRAFSHDARTQPRIIAEQSSLRIHGERIETYLVTIEENDQTLLEFHVNELGQILHAKTLIGYTLVPDDFGP